MYDIPSKESVISAFEEGAYTVDNNVLLGADAQFSGYERCVVGHTDSLAVGLAVADASSEGVRRGPVGETARAATVCFFAEKENVPALGGCGLDLGAARDHSTAIFLSKEFS